jgi:ClpP class serine protease
MAPSVKFHALREETITGSIGVLASFWRYHRLLDYLKIDPERYASGILKDSGAGDQPSGALERQYLQMLVSSMAERFYAVVWKARPHISETEKEELKTAKIVVGDQAVKMKLAHAVLSREEAIRKAKELSGSKVIFTREELKKMSKAAEAVPTYGYQTPPLSESDWWIEWLREIRAGSGLRIEYLMPLRF